jgi:CheY-like chemotaxis protein
MSISLSNKTILVVEDDADTREVLRFALELVGASVVAVASVDAALETYRQSPPHAVIADIRLGRSDGYALIKAIRETDVEYRGFTPAIAVTGFASSDDEDRAMAAGFSAYLTKPFDPAQVVTMIARLLSRSGDLAA